MVNILDLLLQIDKALFVVVNKFGIFVYPILFLVIFLETGFVIAPFLPGDSLLFAAGVISSQGLLNIYLLLILFAVASILGDTVNYFIGKYVGKKIIKHNWIKKEHMKKTEHFFEKYGNKTIFLARFVPIVRTVAPFTAGVGKMDYSKFIFYNIVGGIVWTLLFTLLGFFFGKLPIVEENFSLMIIIIVIVSTIPLIVTYIKEKYFSKKKK